MNYARYISIALGFLLASCASVAYKPVATQINEAAVSSLEVATAKGSPFFAIKPKDEEQIENYLNIFISPSCNFCGNLTLDLLHDVVSGNETFQDTLITFTLIPRQEADFRVVAGLMCIDHEDFPSAVVGYYESIRAVNGRDVITNSLMNRHYIETMEAKNITAAERISCEEDVDKLKVISSYALLAIELRKRDKVPVIIYNGQYYSEHKFDVLTRMMK